MVLLEAPAAEGGLSAVPRADVRASAPLSPVSTSLARSFVPLNIADDRPQQRRRGAASHFGLVDMTVAGVVLGKRAAGVAC